MGANLHEGELLQAKLSITFAGGGRRGTVSIKVPNRIDINAGINEQCVERLLDDAGIRGHFEDTVSPTDLWSSYPWRLSETD
ncbi:MAG: hypothetical protein ACR2RB_04870 [Gammaproteobacteria bacterium]